MFFKLLTLVKNNKIILENYLFMTVLQALNSLFYLLIYPYLITTLGIEGYGLYVFAMSITNYFISLVSFGFDYPAVKEIAQNSENQVVKSNVVSSVFTAKIYLELLSFVVYLALLVFIPVLRQHWYLYIILFGNTFVNILFPIWYFQGIQKMRVVTYIQLGFKILSLPFIFLFVLKPTDVFTFSLITTLFGNFRNKRAIKKEEFYLFIENEEIAERIWQ